MGWDIDIRSEEEMKREIASQMEQMLSAPLVPLTFIEGITPSDSETLAEHGIETIEQLADASVDDICDWLDLSVDEAEDLLDTAQQIAEARRERLSGSPEEEGDEDYVDESAEVAESTDELEVIEESDSEVVADYPAEETQGEAADEQDQATAPAAEPMVAESTTEVGAEMGQIPEEK